MLLTPGSCLGLGISAFMSPDTQEAGMDAMLGTSHGTCSILDHALSTQQAPPQVVKNTKKRSTNVCGFFLQEIMQNNTGRGKTRTENRREIENRREPICRPPPPH